MREINPEETTRAEAFRLWMDAPMPMVTLIKTVDCDEACPVQPEERAETEYADVLVCRTGGQRHQGVLHAAGRTEDDAV